MAIYIARGACDNGCVQNAFIAKLCRFGPLTDVDMAAVTRAVAKPRKYARRQDLIREGDRPGPMFVILEGWGCRYKILPNGTRQIMAFLMPGDACDLHIGLLAEMDHSIQTITPALVATVDRADMDAIMDRHPTVMKAMYVAQLVDEGTLRAWITSMGRRSSVERVAHLLCELYLRARNVGMLDHATEFTLPLSQLILADALGMTPVHLNRKVTELRMQSAVALRRGHIIITDPAKLVTIAGFDENYLHRRLRAAA